MNALENVVKPRLENTISYIKGELDELEREEFFRCGTGGRQGRLAPCDLWPCGLAVIVPLLGLAPLALPPFRPNACVL